MDPCITRPNGKVYVPRKGLAIAEFDDLGGGGTGIVVLRTHSVAEASTFAFRQLVYYDLNMRHYQLDWWRLMVQKGDYRWVTDEVRGMPCVVWCPD